MLSDLSYSGPQDLVYWAETLESPCFVYIIRSGPGEGPIKIGVAKNIKRRIGTLQTGNPRPLELLYVLPANSSANALVIEKEFHRRASRSAVRGEWFAGAEADLVLLIADGMARRMRDAHDGSGTAPHFWALFPESTEQVAVGWAYDEPEADEREADCEAGIGPLPEEYWPRISSMFMDTWTMEEMAAELDVTVGRLDRTMTWMRYRAGYELDPRTRRMRDYFGYESDRRWIRAS